MAAMLTADGRNRIGVTCPDCSGFIRLEKGTLEVISDGRRAPGEPLDTMSLKVHVDEELFHRAVQEHCAANPEAHPTFMHPTGER